MLLLHHIQIQHKDNITHLFHGFIFSWCVVLEVSPFNFLQVLLLMFAHLFGSPAEASSKSKLLQLDK
jgi:hypothetical protein